MTVWTTLKQLMRGESGFSALHVALGFAALGLLSLVFLTPAVDRAAQRMALQYLNNGSVDNITTGSVRRSADRPPVNGASRSRGQTRRYTIRRSVLNKNPSEPCIIYDDGARSGNC
ncbi:MAG: hypothetical protein AAGF28_12975 [Pseudomonadota bacterium]